MYTQMEEWEQIYQKGRQLNRAPFDQVVSFLYHNTPKDKPRKEVEILELGCGAGNNIWFAAREGWSVTGLDISETAIKYAQNRFKEDGLHGEFILGEFMSIADLNKKFDFIIERAAFVSIPFEQAKDVVKLLPRIMKDNAKMLFCTYSDRHSECANGTFAENGMTINMKGNDRGGWYCYSRREIFELFKNDFVIEKLTHVEKTDMVTGNYYTHAEWVVVARKR